MRDRDEPDDKILAVPFSDPSYDEFFDIGDIPQHVLREVEVFPSLHAASPRSAVLRFSWRWV